MSILKLCSNDPLISLLRDTFQANPIRIPEERIQPLTVLAVQNNKYEFLGKIEHLLENTSPIELEILNSQMADVSSTKSNAVDAALGLKVMDTFLKGMGCSNVAGITNSFNSKVKVSFSFRNVNRKYVELSALIRTLNDKKFVVDNSITKSFINDEKKCIIITDIITSKSFSIKKSTTSENNIQFSLPDINELISIQDSKIMVEKNSDLEITFTGEKELAFAFKGVEIGIDDDGLLYSDTAVDKAVLTSGSINVNDENETKVFSMEEFGLIEFENESQ